MASRGWVVGALSMNGAVAMPTDYIFWWKADSLGLSDGTAVGSWTDSSGNSLTATQSTTANKPIYRAAPTGFNGKPALQFTASSTQNLQLPYTSTVNPSAMSIFIVFRPNNATSSMGMVSSHEQSLGTSGYVVTMASSPAGTVEALFRDSGGANAVISGTVGAASTHWAAMTTTGSGTNGFGYLDGASHGGAGAGGLVVNTTDPLIIGYDPNFGSPHAFDGYIAEIIGYSRVLSSGERGAVDAYIQAKYGL